MPKEPGVPKDSTLKKLDPFIDENGLMRIEGRITEAKLERDERNPLTIPVSHHIARLLVLNKADIKGTSLQRVLFALLACG